jgi:hypothetical protein
VEPSTQRLVPVEKIPRKDTMPRKVDYIYLSGILDGEGCITVGAGKRSACINYNPIVVVQNTNKELIDWLQKTFGGQVYLSKKETSKTKAAWSWRITKKRNIELLLLAVLPYIRVKREQAKLLLTFVRLERTAPTAQRVDLYEELRRLNSRGKSVTTNMQNADNTAKIESELHGDMQSDPTVTLEG